MSGNGIEIDPKKTEVVKNLPRPQTVTNVRAFLGFKELCCSTPILAYPNDQKKFILHTDASDQGLGAVLYQLDDNNKKRVIAFTSRSLNPAEKNYPTHKLECLTLNWTVTKRFHEYL